jgi:excisionase family DNA binding protein
MLDKLLTTKELADYLKVNEMTIYKLLQASEIPGIKIGRKWRFRESTINSWLKEKEAESINRLVPAHRRWNFLNHKTIRKENELFNVFKISF